MNLVSKRVFLLDMDGTFYLGDKILPGSLDFIRTLERQHKLFFFLTNNSSRNSVFYARKLQQMGLQSIHPDQIITSGEVCAWYLKRQFPTGRIYLLGTKELAMDFMREGLTLVQVKPDGIVLGFDKTLTYEKVKTACTFLRKGIPFFATHPDLNCPTETGPIPDIGSMIKMMVASTGVKPKIFGKPYPDIVEYVISKTHVSQEELVMVGDRLYTDIAMGKESGITTILVLSGETRREDLTDSPWKPDHIFPTLGDVGASLESELNSSFPP